MKGRNRQEMCAIRQKLIDLLYIAATSPQTLDPPAFTTLFLTPHLLQNRLENLPK
jgi:hypothetical protein